MRITLRLTPLPALALLLLAQCQSKGEQAPATTTPTAAAPAGSAPAAASSATAPAAASTASGASAYAMCKGEHVANAAGSPPVGPVEVQLAPAYLDEMAACRAEDGVPKELIARAADGKINAKGDCVFADIGVSCHYHSGSEFIQSSVHQQTPGQGELHCIFPSSDPKNPRVYGTHLTCKDHADGKPKASSAHAARETHEAHVVHEGASCPAKLLNELEPCKTLRCCDHGTLTNPIADLEQNHNNDVRPDFRICEESLEIDCKLLTALTAHPANSPGLGGVGVPAFELAAAPAASAPAPAPKASAHPKK